jgi:hypothetical protein
MSTPLTQQPAALRDELLGRATALVPVLRERAVRTEHLRHIPPETVQDLVSSGLIRIGNLESDPIQRFHRDVHGASHHAALTWDPPAEQFGRQALGLGKSP